MKAYLLEGILREHNATVEAVRRAQACGLHLGSLLVEVCEEIGKAEWGFWLRYHCPIPEDAARRYVIEPKRLKQAA